MMEGWTKPQVYEYCKVLYSRKLMLQSKSWNNPKAIRLLQMVQIRLEWALDRFNTYFK